MLLLLTSGSPSVFLSTAERFGDSPCVAREGLLRPVRGVEARTVPRVARVDELLLRVLVLLFGDLEERLWLALGDCMGTYYVARCAFEQG